jgi:chloride channel protein, CIC family
VNRHGTGVHSAPLYTLVMLALATGAATALGVLVFKQLVSGAEFVAFGWHAEAWRGARPLVILLAPVVGGIIVGIILHAAGEADEPGHGVTEVIEAAAMDEIRFEYERAPLKAGVAALSLGSGAALGPEDPAVEIGGGIGAAIASRLGLSHTDGRALVAIGGAAGLAAAFHAPLAAIVFAREVFNTHIRSTTMSLVAVAAASSYGVTQLLGEQPFEVPTTTLSSAGELLLAAVVGVLAGVTAGLHVRFMYAVQHRVIAVRAVPRWLKPALGGVVLGGVGVFLPDLLGPGYEPLEDVLAGERAVPAALLVLCAGKLLLMAVSFGSGYLGGFFVPSFFIGATLGAATGYTAVGLVPAVTEPAAFAVIGMAALLAGTVHAPVTAVLVARALVGGFALLPFLAVACIISYVVARLIEPLSLYTYSIEDHGAQLSDIRRAHVP